MQNRFPRIACVAAVIAISMIVGCHHDHEDDHPDRHGGYYDEHHEFHDNPHDSDPDRR